MNGQTTPDTSAPHLCLWNTEAFYALRETPRFHADHHADGHLVGSLVAGAVYTGSEQDELVSGYSAPFGGPDFVRPNETLANIAGLVRASAVWASRSPSIRIRCKPPHYGENEARLLWVLHAVGFTVAAVDLNYYIDLRPFATVEDYEASLKKETRRAIRHASGVTVRLAVDEMDWQDGYYVLKANRVRKGRPMRLTLDYVLAARDAFGDCVRMLVAEHDTAIIAAALLYRIAPGHDVVQHWGDAHDLPCSPMALLARDVVAHSLATGGRFLDLGISTNHGTPNAGLMQFKRSVGASVETRLEMVGTVADVLDHSGWALLDG